MAKKYLRIKLVGHDYVKAFEQADSNGNQPRYKGDGVAVWVNESDDDE